MSSHSDIQSPASEQFNWLDAISGNKAFFDPRTCGVHKFSIPILQSTSLPIEIEDDDQKIVTSVSRDAIVARWLEIDSIWEGRAPEPNPASAKECKFEGMEEMVTVEEWDLEPISLELHPQYPQLAAENSLFSLHRQICQEVDLTDSLEGLSSHRHNANKRYLTSSHHYGNWTSVSSSLSSITPSISWTSFQTSEIRQSAVHREPELVNPILIDPTLESHADAFSCSTDTSVSMLDEWCVSAKEQTGV
ncbi:hypothetical protein N7462_005664 [Penicillium macrosclerotiorum]|uniref:uncharacterized protein n=1 Tax=Penicillium macrosclerotiorum TaxID=303699 RepID=UPI00254913E3|nr:uncharacterized protein N7462_005664 [Penicillium macrosclerotiorum]KAJ5682499.1 hypothetical protein N7462_005664 [Penicillium macrosclerotiorum]